MTKWIQRILLEINRQEIDITVAQKKELSKKLETALSELLSENEDAKKRLAWLEDAIDDKNLEDIFIEYQRKFKLEYWSG